MTCYGIYKLIYKLYAAFHVIQFAMKMHIQAISKHHMMKEGYQRNAFASFVISRTVSALNPNYPSTLTHSYIIGVYYLVIVGPI